MSDRVCDFYSAGEFEQLLEDAEGGVRTPWEDEFISDMIDKFAQYQDDMYLSERQHEVLLKMGARP